MKNKISHAIFFLMASVLVVLDQITKIWSQKQFLIHSSENSIHSYFSQSQQLLKLGEESKNFLEFSLTYVRNTGAAWGFLGNMPENIRPYFFWILSLVAMVVILWFFLKTPRQDRVTRLGMALIFSGAMGNFIDRVYLHYVIDWLHFRWKIFGWSYDFPVFNVADSCVTVGAILLFIEALYGAAVSQKLNSSGQ